MRVSYFLGMSERSMSCHSFARFAKHCTPVSDAQNVFRHWNQKKTKKERRKRKKRSSEGRGTPGHQILRPGECFYL